MKREYAEISEISDDEWETHSESFKPSRVLKINTRSPKPKPQPKPPPPIESFAYNKSNNLDENLEDDDVEEVVGPTAATNNRGRRFIVDDDEDEEEEEEEREQEQGDFVEVYDIKSSSEDEEEELLILEDEIENDDVVGKALQKCAKISAELKRELYGTTTSAACDRYAEVEASSVRIVTQSDIDDACGAEDSDFQPVLKPYQLVGVNFLLLLYRKGIAGGKNALINSCSRIWYSLC